MRDLIRELEAELEDIGHPYPLKIFFEAIEFIRGGYFITLIQIICCDEYIKDTNNIKKLRSDCDLIGIEEEEYGFMFDNFDLYLSGLGRNMVQSAVIALVSYWDWYIRNLGKFVLFAREHVASPSVGNKDLKYFERLGFTPILKQLDLLELFSGVTLNLEIGAIEDLRELTLVRNIALHNRWEVDKIYNKYSTSSKYNIGDLREVNMDELKKWDDSLAKAIVALTREISIKYKCAPPYP